MSASRRLRPEQRSRWLAVFPGALVAALICAAPAAAGPVDGPRVRVATTGNDSELVKTLEITRRVGAAPRVVMSMGPNTLGDLISGDLLELTAEMQVTVNCNYKSPRCVGPIYHYDPHVTARLVIAPSATATGGADTLRIGRAENEVCTQRKPDREHHCVLTFTGDRLEIDAARLPCELDACFVNLVADAHNRRARHGDLIMVGGQRPNGHIPQDRGRINAIRYRDSRPSDFRTLTTSARLRSALRPDFTRRVVYWGRLDGLRDGEQLAVAATITLDISHLPYALRDSTRLILADSPRATRQSAFVKSRAFVRGEIAENNGSNCTQDERLCTTRKVGVVELRRDAVTNQGKPVPLFVNLITVVGPKAARAHRKDRALVRRSGSVAVTRFPPSVNGKR